MARTVLHHIGGARVASISGRRHPDHDPWTRAVLAEVASGDGEDARRAIEAAHAAFPAWSEMAPSDRQLIFIRAADALDRRRDEVIELLAAETGCGAYFADVQSTFSLALLRQAAGLAHAPTGQIL